MKRSMSPKASGPIHFRSCLEGASGGLTSVTGFGGVTVAEDMGWPPLAENDVLILSALHQCELLAVIDNRVQCDKEVGCATPGP